MVAPTIACVIIASERRKALVCDRVLHSVVGQMDFDEMVVVGDWQDSEDALFAGVRYLCVEPMLRNTTDALVKRDVGTLATRADILVYLCDDHALAPNFLTELREVINEEWDVVVPNRYCRRGDLGMDDNGNVGPANSRTFHHPAPIVALNNGERDGYCGGHAGIFRRAVIQQRPWSAHSHNRLWDVTSSHDMQRAGAKFCWSPRAGIAVIDLEPDREPWK